MWATIDSAPMDQPIIGWNGKEVLVIRGHKIVDRIFWDDLDCWDHGGYGDVYPLPTHWHPLPDKPA